MPRKCVLCNSSSALGSTSKKPQDRSYMRCPVCDLIFVPEEFHLLPQAEAARYRLHENNLTNEGYVRMFLDKIELLRQYCHGVSSVMDYGCGPEPVLAQLLKKDGYDCDFYDPYFFPAYPGKTYDVVISTEVFEHFRDVRSELHKVRSLLKPGGFLAVMTSFHDAVRDFEDWWYVSDPTHICFFGMRTFEWIAKEFGLSIAYTDRKNFIILQAE